jgi:hypothetical protein
VPDHCRFDPSDGVSAASPVNCSRFAVTAPGLEVVMDRCLKIEHARFFGGLNTIGLNTGLISARKR